MCSKEMNFVRVKTCALVNIFVRYIQHLNFNSVTKYLAVMSAMVVTFCFILDHSH